MKPETKAFLAQADTCLDRSARMIAADLNEDAARTAYLACFQVAQAVIFERSGKTVKSHHGVHTEFFRLTKDDVHVDTSLRRYLARAYEFKTVADYLVGSDGVTSPEQAAETLSTAIRFVAHFSALLPSNGEER